MAGNFWILSQTEGLFRVALSGGTERLTIALDRSLSEKLFLVPGSFTRLRGAGIGGDGSSPPRLQLNGQPMPVLQGGGNLIETQISWEASTTPNSQYLVIGWQDQPLELVTEAFLFARRPVFEGAGTTATGDFIPKGLHEDWRGVVTESDPALPGETVHYYMTGLGTVEPAVPTGEPSTSVPLSRTTGTLECTVTPPSLTPSAPGMPVPAQVQFSGLAPGLIGVYQVDITVPSGVKGTAALLCTTSGAFVFVLTWIG